MISVDISAKDLRDYYKQLCKAQATAHKKEYLLVHNELDTLLKGCNSYTELGVNQGTTLAIALFNKIKTIRAYDITLELYNKARDHFNNYAATCNLDYKVFEADTLKTEIEPCDLLYIDTLHRYEQLKKELNLHGNKANKYIVFHDTFAKPELKKAIKEYLKVNLDWKIITECDMNVGFMTIGRK